MKIWRNSTALSLIAVALAAAGMAIPALGQDAPESLLPPGFGDPAPTPAPTPRPAQPRPDAPRTPPPSASPAPTPAPGVAAADDSLSPEATPTPGEAPSATPAPALALYALPDYARRGTAQIGVADAASLSGPIYGNANGPLIQMLMRRMNAPIASRWLSITLRRVLLAPSDTPRDLNGADFAAERAWLLIRMGEANAARALVQSVDGENYTPKLDQVAMQAMLAAADPGGVCPLAGTAGQRSRERGWVLAQAWCTALEGKAADAGRMIDAARRARIARGIDLALAEKMLSRGAQGRRDVTIDWDEADRLSSWRYGLATALGEALPEPLLAAASPQMVLWQAQAPQLAPVDRLTAAEAAAAAGVLSSAAYADLYGAIDESGVDAPAAVAVASDLRTANVGPTRQSRMEVLRRLWDEPTTPVGRYARLVLTAKAAGGIGPDPAIAGDADRLIAAMLSAGHDLRAVRWRSVATPGSDGWAMLALADPAGRTLSRDAAASYQGQGRKAQLFVAALAGLGRLAPADAESLAADNNVPIGAQNRWTRAIQAAANARQAGTVVVLAGIGMQTTDWRGVPAHHLFHILAALRAVGMDAEARMIAAEAIARG